MQEDSQPDEELNTVSSLKLKWALGLNYKIYDGVHNLTNHSRKELFYAVGNTGVVYDYENNTQRLLQGHCNQITCTAYNRNRQILITADSGEDSMLVIWDVQTGVPKKTIFDPHPGGVMALDVSVSGDLIVTISKAEQAKNQLITLWRWEDEDPSYITTQLDPRIDCIQRFIKFNENQNEFVTTGQTRLIFWSWDTSEKGFEFYSPNMPPKRIFTQTVFIPNSTQAVTGTKDGMIIVWDISLIMEDYSQPEERRPIKQVNLMSNNNKIDAMKKNLVQPSINVLKIEGRFLVVGSSNGCVRFYDNQYRIQAWFEDIDIGSIHTISFSSETTQTAKDDDISVRDKDADSGEPFECPDFIVVDDKARVTLLKAELFEKIDKAEKKGEVLMESIVAPIVASAVRPHSHTIAISCENSVVYEWNFHQKNSIIHVLKEFKPDEVPTCLNYSPNSKYLAVATKVGNIYMYEIQKEKDPWHSPLLVAQIEKGKPAITMQIFAPDSKHLATMDEDFGVTLFVLGENNWVFGGKVRVHYAPIRSIAFGESMDERSDIKLRLFSISEDMRMAEYEVQTKKDDSSEQKYKKLKLKSVFPIEQECFPTACIWYPINLYKENVLLTVNEQYKMKLWSMMKDNLKVCKKTCLGPTYGGQINKLLVLNSVDERNDYQEKYLAYATKEKVVGIIKLPLDGNPNNTIGLIAHSNKITGINSTVDGKLFFTSGAEDFCVNMWEVDFSALEQNFYVAPTDDPFPELLEGGPTGQTMSDLKDFFYYSQIRSKDEHTTKARKLDGKVPLEAIANMMRSMGYYPTQKEIENMQNEIKFSSYMDSFKETVNELDLNMFLKLFVNHRPVYGIGKSHITSAMNTLTEGNGNRKGVLSKEELIRILTTEGEKMTMEEIKECEKILLGEGNELPDEIDGETLCHKILGFQDLDSADEGVEEDPDEEEA